MKLLLTSAGLTNPTIVRALKKLLRIPFRKAKVVFIPTAANVERGDKDWLIANFLQCQKAGFAEVDIVDISAIPVKMWKARLKDVDVLMFGGGNTFHLMHWVRKSGLEKLLPTLLKKAVYVGISAGSMIVTPNLGLSQSRRLYNEGSLKDSDQALGFVPFLVRPHLNSRYFTKLRIPYLKKLAKEIPQTIYALDDDSAIAVNGKNVQVVSEGRWAVFNKKQ